MRPVELNRAVSNVFGLLGRQLLSRGIFYDLDLDETLPPILGDINRLEQVFINLILNSRDAILNSSVSERKILIRSFLDDARVTVVVSDTGPGIPKELRNKVFEPFFTTKKPGEGTGLGLSISYGIVTEHNGACEIEDNDTGGAVFRLSFPAHRT
jgi:histidine kinase